MNIGAETNFEFNGEWSLAFRRASPSYSASGSSKIGKNCRRYFWAAILMFGLVSLASAQQRTELTREQEMPRDSRNDSGNNTSDHGDSESFSDAPSALVSEPRIAIQLSFKERFKLYRRTILRPYSVLGPAYGAGVGQWENEPPEWGQGAAGYARRFGSGMGRHVISETIRFGVSAIDGEDPRYYASTDTGVW